MKIQILIRDSNFKKFSFGNYDPEEDDVRSILSDVCHVVEKQVDFYVSGFGDEHWPVDCGTDLAVFLEQLPDALQAIKEGKPFNINFYEQGIERCIEFSPLCAGGNYFSHCVSRTGWKPNPEFEENHKEMLFEMLIGARNDFIKIIYELSPELAEHPWILEWKSL